MYWTCDLCFPNAIEIGMIAPGYALVRDKSKYMILGGQGHRGDFIYTFTRKPIWDPYYEFLLLPDELATDEKEAELKEAGLDIASDVWLTKLAYPFMNHKMQVDEGYNFVQAAIEAGYDKDQDGWIANWVINKCALLIDMHKAGLRA